LTAPDTPRYAGGPLEPSSATRRPGPPSPPPPAGALLGSRYRLTGFIGKSPFGEVLRAEPAEGGEPVAVLRVRPELVATPGAAERLEAEVARACTLEHPNILKPLNFFRDADQVYVVSQLPPGQSLRAIATARRGRFTLRDANGIVSQLANALHHAARMTHHGAITPSNVFIEPSGMAHLAEMGVARALPAQAAEVDPADRPALAPELPASTGRSDLYSLGAILFELVTGRPHAPGALPRQVKPELPAELDALVARLVEPAPDDRFADPETVRSMLAEITAAVEADHAARREKQAQRASNSHKAIPPAKQRRQKVKIDHHEHRWLVHKGKLDYGPFTLAELKEKIERDEVVPGDLIIDQELGTRAEAEAHPLLHDLVLAAAQRRDDARRVHVETTVVEHEKRRGVALYAFIALGAGALATGAVLLFVYLRAGQAGGPRKEAAQVEMAAASGLKVGSARSTDDGEAQRRARGGARPARPAAANAAGGDTFDEALSFDMAGEEVGDERLSDDQINAVLTRNVGALGRCLRAEAGRGGARQADIDFIVLGSGKVSQVRVNGETSSALAACVRASMQGLQFPTFNGPRTKASFPMSL
jgi:hypothetical protein